jgi:hypothetical protein
VDPRYFDPETSWQLQSEEWEARVRDGLLRRELREGQALLHRNPHTRRLSILTAAIGRRLAVMIGGCKPAQRSRVGACCRPRSHPVVWCGR